MDNIELVAFALLLAFLNTFLIHSIKTKFPKYYFSLGQLVITENEDISIGGLVTKFGPPIIFGAALGMIFGKHALELTLLYAFFSSFLVIWPVILSGDELLSWEAKNKINVLYLIYFFYILSYEAFAYLGYWIGLVVRGIKVQDWTFGLITAYPNWSPLAQGIVNNIISGAILAIIGAMLAFLYRKLFKVLWRKISEERTKVEDQK
ncbi:MAG: hypothetical protein WC820_00410 [Spirochaetales bacterium]|jgi:hypothetical protein